MYFVRLNNSMIKLGNTIRTLTHFIPKFPTAVVDLKAKEKNIFHLTDWFVFFVDQNFVSSVPTN